MAETTDRTLTAAYGVDELPPWRQAVPMGIQHVLVMFASNVTLPLLVASAIGATTGETTLLVQLAIFVAGVCTLLQTFGVGPVGARLPIVQGTSLGFTVVAIPLAEEYGLAAVFGGGLVAGLVQVLLGTCLRWLKPLFPPLVTGLVVLVIGLSLLPTGLEFAAGGADAPDFGAGQNFALAALVLVLMIALNRYGRGFVSAAAILLAIAVGYLVSVPFGLVEAQPIADAEWVAAPIPLAFGVSFPVAAIVGMAVMAVATTVETIGDIGGVTAAGEGREPTARELSGGVLADGVGTSFAALFSAMPNTSYSQNVGVVGLTGVVSRHVVSIGAVFLVVAGLVPKLGAVISEMPTPVLGGGFLAMAGMVAAAGIKLMTADAMTRRNMLIIAVALGLGIGLLNAPDAVAMAPETLRITLETGIVPAAVAAVLLNAILPHGERAAAPRGADTEERGGATRHTDESPE
ncbi:purine permease [Egibacter rhizosphaerae]|uniref:Purine permease n=1 Tax=Egibacter rhizosphaerae TaxID=1670831 RepID=A0A411YD06_9ACTN|nr:solute carrier family 23 protein [Egibacter rhizosphaerae]QBI19089.1 purine permease [Egibacter rhizosphaerae]